MKKAILVLLITGIFYGSLWLAMELPRNYSGLTAISSTSSISWYSPLAPKNSLQFTCYFLYGLGIFLALKYKNKAKFYEPTSFEWVQSFKK